MAVCGQPQALAALSLGKTPFYQFTKRLGEPHSSPNTLEQGKVSFVAEN